MTVFKTTTTPNSEGFFSLRHFPLLIILKSNRRYLALYGGKPEVSAVFDDKAQKSYQ